MSQFTVLMTKSGFLALDASRGTGKSVVKMPGNPAVTVSREALDAMAQLTLDLPAVDWTFEVDIAGRHRITIHFRGAEISLDAMQVGSPE